MPAPHVVISGSSGLIGTALRQSFEADGIAVTLLVRRPARSDDEVTWQPGGQLDPAVLAGATAVVNLNGATIGRLPWTRGYRHSLIRSRLEPTRSLARAIRDLGTEAPTFVSASAVGYYGDRPGEPLTERSTAGSTFLAQLCVAWEREANAAGPDARVVLLRTASILHPDAVLKPLLLLTRLGLGGPLGSGRQVWPWITLPDEVRAIRHAIDQGLRGPVNLVAPEAATASEIGRELARRLRRPFLLPAPTWALRLGLGQDAADSLLLADAEVSPTVLTESGFVFEHPSLDSALTHALAE